MKSGKKDWTDAFLDALRLYPHVAKACKAAGIAQSTPYMRRDRDPEFAAAWEAAIERGMDSLEDTLVDVAHGEIKIPSQAVTAAIFLLKGRRKAVYSERRQDAGDLTPEAFAKALIAVTKAMDSTVPTEAPANWS